MNTEKQIISHLYQNSKNGKWTIQTNEEHQKGVADLATLFAASFGLPSWGKALGLLHDKGKERIAFQKYIRMSNGLPTDGWNSGEEHHHAFVGGILAHELMGKDVIQLLTNPIISHHTGLHDWAEVEDVLLEKQLPREINKSGISIDNNQLIQEFKNFCLSSFGTESQHFHHLVRMLFSCLIDADRLDTERFMDNASWQKRGGHATISELQPKLENYLQTLQSATADTAVNRLRRKVLEQCMQTATGMKGFYSLTVPTGGGKTLSSLAWAIKHAVTHSMSRIIIAIPYTSIIVQTAGLLKEIFGEENVLEHHSHFNPDDIKSENAREKAKLATENWDYPIIVTTNVQLFESMFSNHPSNCRKLHNIVNAVIILDEVQTLPIGFLQPIVDAMKAYRQLFGVSFLLTTASQPVLSGLIEGVNPQARFKGIDSITEIIPEDFALYNQLRRVTLHIDHTGDTYDNIAVKVAKHDRVLCIVNTRKDAKELFDRLPDNGLKFHLSRMMCPAHISQTISHIKNLLKSPSHPILRVVATQLVEAGVDIDFPVVFRQEAGLDSILQAAGRCNREGKNALGHTYVFSLSAENRIPFGSMAKANDARKSLPTDCDWLAPTTMEMYFKQLYSRETFDTKHIKDYLYKMKELQFASGANAFRLIEDENISVIVNWENSMDLVTQLKTSGRTYPLMKQLARFTVGLRRTDFRLLQEYDAVKEIIEGIYIVPDSTQYDKHTGLSLTNHWLQETLMV